MTLAFRKSSHRFLFIDVFIKAMGFIELKSVLCIAIVGENLSPIYILSIGIATYNMNVAQKTSAGIERTARRSYSIKRLVQ